MASRPNSSQTTSNNISSTSAKEATGHSKTEASKLKVHGKVIHKFTSESYMRLTCEKSSSTASNDDTKFIDKSSSSTSIGASSISSGSGFSGAATAAGVISTGGVGGGQIMSNSINSSNNNNNVTNKRKGASFQITSVSVSSANTQQQQHHHHHHHHQGGVRNSTDNNGDDSADDLDDSHTDDNISRITDYETPSMSETFSSGEDVFFAQQNAFGTAPVIPTSSQYGLAIVTPDHHGGSGSGLTDVHVSVTDAGINIMGPISSKQDSDHKNDRFKVVKIESTEPFKRGRWMCMDYLDHTTLQDDGIDGSGSDGATTKDESADGSTEYTQQGSKTVLFLNNGETLEHVISDNEDLDHEVNKINSKNHVSFHHHHHNNETNHPQTMTTIPSHNNDFSNVNNNIHAAQTMPQAQIEKILNSEKDMHSMMNNNVNFQQQQSSIGLDQMSSPNYVTSQSQQQQHAQTMTQEMIHACVMHQEQMQQTQQFHQQQGVTLPSNILLQNLQQSHQIISPNSTSNVALPPQMTSQQQSLLATPNNNNNNSNINNATSIPQQHENLTSLQSGGGIETMEFGNNQQQHDSTMMTSQFQNSQIGAGDNRMHNNESDNINNQQVGNVLENITSSDNNNNNNTMTTTAVVTINSNESVSSPSSSSAGLGTVADGATSVNASEINDNTGASATVAEGDGQALNEDTER